VVTGVVVAVAWTGPAAADTGSADTGSADTGSADAGSADAGSADAGISFGFGNGLLSGIASGSAMLPLASPRAMLALGIARSQTGKPYEWGATGPAAYDCSGLVQWAFRQVGILLPRTTWQQARAGSPVPLSAIEPGDVVVLNSDGSHEGIYAGNGQVLNAYDYGVGVVLTPLSQFDIYAIRRFY
jgi:hypothetical protein